MRADTELAKGHSGHGSRGTSYAIDRPSHSEECLKQNEPSGDDFDRQDASNALHPLAPATDLHRTPSHGSYVQYLTSSTGSY
jgi:hypothetical protein